MVVLRPSFALLLPGRVANAQEMRMTSLGGIGNGGDIPNLLMQNLFNEIDTSGSGSINKSELEQAVTTAGGTAAAADALYAKLDPTNTGSVTEQHSVRTCLSCLSAIRWARR
jgi:hypothetical protein